MRRVVLKESMEYRGNEYSNTVFLVESELVVENCVFRECDFVFLGNHLMNLRDSVRFVSCRFVGRGDSVKCLGKVEFSACNFLGMDGCVLTVDSGAWCVCDGCMFLGNGSTEVLGPQVTVDGAEVRFRECQFFGGRNSFAIESANSRVYLSGSVFWGNEGGGLALYSSSFLIERCRISENGQFDGDFAQVYVEDSSGRIVDSCIRLGINADGFIAAKQSVVELVNCDVIGHGRNGVVVERGSVVNMNGCSLYGNGSIEEETTQVWADDSRIVVRSSAVCEGVRGVYAQKGSSVVLKGNVIKGNRGGVYVLESSEVYVEDCTFDGNVDGPQLWVKGSKAFVVKSSFKGGDFRDIVAEEMVLLHVVGVKAEKGVDVDEESRNVYLDVSKS